MTKPTDEESPEPESPLVQIAHYSGHGLTLALSTGMFLVGGWWVDGKLGSRPLFTIIGAFVGAGAGFYSVVQHLVLMPRERARRAAEKGAGSGGMPESDRSTPEGDT